MPAIFRVPDQTSRAEPGRGAPGPFQELRPTRDELLLPARIHTPVARREYLAHAVVPSSIGAPTKEPHSVQEPS
jgi:hypothetical protein